MILHCLIAVALLAGNTSSTADNTMDQLGWLEGHWVSEAFGGKIEEFWLPSSGNAMHGVFRLTVEDSLEFSEFLQVTKENDQFIMRFKHFRPNYSTWEGDGTPMELKAIEVTSDRIVFEAINETSPSRIVYFKAGEEIHVTITGIENVIRFRRSQ